MPQTVTDTLRSTIKEASNGNSMEAYFVWSNSSFHRLSPDECDSITLNSEVWTYFTHWKYNKSTG